MFVYVQYCGIITFKHKGCVYVFPVLPCLSGFCKNAKTSCFRERMDDKVDLIEKRNGTFLNLDSWVLNISRLLCLTVQKGTVALLTEILVT